MKKSPALLMKELTAIEKEIARIHRDDTNNSLVPVDEDYKPLYKTTYNFESNLEKIESLFQKQSKIKALLNSFNVTTKIEGTNLTISDALVRIAQLKSEVSVLETLLSRNDYVVPTYNEKVQKVVYDFEKVKETFDKLNEELSTLRVAVDTINLTYQIEF